jgi:C4-dicarboxylate-specific signal transduction histidine kinase
MVREAVTKGIAAKRTIPEGKEGEFVSWTVSDTVAGTSAEVPAQIFAPLFTNRRKGGIAANDSARL